MYCIVLADRPHGSWKRTFLKTGLRVEKYENAALPFSCGCRIRLLSETITPSPHPSTSSLWPLNPVTSHNNNGGWQHACAGTAADIGTIRVTRAKYYAPLPLCWAKNITTSFWIHRKGLPGEQPGEDFGSDWVEPAVGGTTVLMALLWTTNGGRTSACPEHLSSPWAKNSVHTSKGKQPSWGHRSRR